jgi:hypothetical protein
VIFPKTKKETIQALSPKAYMGLYREASINLRSLLYRIDAMATHAS